ncbi:MAG: hypothetical protein JJ850_02615 [Kordiimonadaceae bacterium]|nr:hypothetical protein [Kordiimonadaceae bacterium]MBO6567301.1 hypothetical protein [Kordiimonadaceae bacterium]MBO6963485.1 hypothetical protein [Kordiimonadaceae bacterium]
MKPINTLLYSLLVAIACVLWIVFTPEPIGATGSPHPDVPSMRVAVDGEARYTPISAPILILQTATLTAMASLLLLPFKTPLRQHGMRRRLMLVLGLSVIVWLAINMSYERFLTGPQEMENLNFIAGFPLPSALAVYAVWGVGLLLTFFYVFGFNRFIYTNEDREGFEALLREHEGES